MLLMSWYPKDLGFLFDIVSGRDFDALIVESSSSWVRKKGIRILFFAVFHSLKKFW